MPVPGRFAVAALAATLLAPGAAPAQIIPVKTVPLADVDQFGFFPSANLGMAGVSIALPDTTLDPFSNPATAARFRQRYFFGAPTFFAVSNDAGSGQTLPLGAFFSQGNTFGGVALAVQQINPPRRRTDQFPGVAFDARPVTAPGFTQPPTQEAEPQGNRFAFATIGRRLPSAGLSVAASAFVSGLHAMDGVEGLYEGSQNVRQRGHTVDLRLGALKQWPGGGTLETVLARNSYRMAHDPSFLDNYWDPIQRQVLARTRVEHNLDQTNTWGAHAVYERPIARGWRAGALVTGNLLSHPQIAGDEFLSIPRSPGRSAAYNLGVGVSRAAGKTTVGLDAIYEPIRSHTWADADAEVAKTGGGTIPAGGKTLENRFRFSNGIVRAGVSHDIPVFGGEATTRLQLGVQGRGISYRMHQWDHVRGTVRLHEEQWGEWTRSWGASLRFSSLHIDYRGRMTSGTGRPGTEQNIFAPGILEASSFSGPNIVAAPTGQMRLDAVNVVTHQLSLSLPIR